MADSRQERFVTVRAFRTPDGLNMEHFVKVILYEAIQPGASLKSVMKKAISGNHGDIVGGEIISLLTELFVSGKYTDDLTSIKRDGCIGYTEEEETLIVSACHAHRDIALIAMDRSVLRSIMDIHFPRQAPR